jgi:hypothetical protein
LQLAGVDLDGKAEEFILLSIYCVPLGSMSEGKEFKPPLTLFAVNGMG